MAGKLEVVTVMLHAIISVIIVISYVFLLAKGIDNETLKFCVVGVVGYWFGVTTRPGWSSKPPTNGDGIK